MRPPSDNFALPVSRKRGRPKYNGIHPDRERIQPNRIQPDLRNGIHPTTSFVKPLSSSSQNGHVKFDPFEVLGLRGMSKRRIFPTTGNIHHGQLKEIIAGIYKEGIPEDGQPRKPKCQKLVELPSGIEKFDTDHVLGFRVRENGVVEYLCNICPEDQDSCPHSQLVSADTLSPEQMFNYNTLEPTKGCNAVIDLTKEIIASNKNVTIDLTKDKPIDIIDLD